MTLRILFSGAGAEWPVYEDDLTRAFAAEDLSVDLIGQTADPTNIDYIICSPDGPVSDFSPFAKLKAAMSLWAGVETLAANPTLKAPLARMVDPGLTAGMVEWVTGHVLRYHLGVDAHILGQDGVWRGDSVPPLATERRVGVLGLGELGLAVARALHTLGFDVRGLSRTPKTDPNLQAFSGEKGLEAVLTSSDILVALLPATPATENILNPNSLSLLPDGARILNPGRGTLIDDDALITALNTGKVAHATLDVFREEPLPPDHPYWVHPRVTVTPHIASTTRSRTASQSIAANIRAHENGADLSHLVDRSLGY